MFMDWVRSLCLRPPPLLLMLGLAVGVRDFEERGSPVLQRLDEETDGILYALHCIAWRGVWSKSMSMVLLCL
jgi:hypothetical protein